MRNLTRLSALAIGIGLLTAPPARAQGYVAPALGIAFGNPSAQGRADFVADLGYVSRVDPLGVDLDVTYAPSFFGNAGPYGENSVTTFMGNIVLASGSGIAGFGRYRRSTRPYVSGGAGVLHEVVTTAIASNKIANTDLGVNVGAGVMAFTGRTFGVRADVRYFRDLVDNQRGNTTNIDFGSFHFWRASLGVILAF